MTSLEIGYPTLLKGQSRVHLSPVIVLRPWFSTELPDISGWKVANTTTAPPDRKQVLIKLLERIAIFSGDFCQW